MGSPLMPATTFETFDSAVTISASISSFPSGPVRTAMFPPAPSSTVMLRRSFCTVIGATVASLNAFCTSESSCANNPLASTQPAATAMPDAARNRRREISDRDLRLMYGSLEFSAHARARAAVGCWCQVCVHGNKAGRNISPARRVRRYLAAYFVLGQESFDAAGDFFSVRLQREVSGIQQMRFQISQI